MNAPTDHPLSLDKTGRQTPTVFVRTLAAPPGLPWDQARAAALEARVGAPLPLSEVVYRLRRLDGWAPGRPARYAACYVRAQEAGETFETTVEIDGRTIPVQFLSAAELNRRAQRLGAIAAIAGVTCLLFGLAISSAIAIRGETEDRLSAADLHAETKLRLAHSQARLYREARLLDAAGVKHQAVSDLLADMAWAAGAKAPGAHIDALHWEHGYLAVEARGETAPFAGGDRAILKADKPVRPGVWLWGVGPAGSAQAQATAGATTAGSRP